MSYRLLPQADRDLESIIDFIADHNPAAALKLLERFHSRWELLSDFPLAGRERTDLGLEARHVVIDNYLTLYRIRDGKFDIVRVLHGRRNIAADDLF